MRTIGLSIRWTIALAALTLWVSAAADIDGKWTGQIQGRGGPRTQTLTLKASGSALTGTIDGGRGGPVEISDGKIDGDSISFNVIREFQDNKITQQYKGTISGNELKLTVSGGRGEPVEVAFKKE